MGNVRDRSGSLCRYIVEAGLLSYLLLIPFAQQIPAWVCNLPMWAVLLGLVLPRLGRLLPGAKPIPFGMLGPFLLFVATTCCSIAFSSYVELSLQRASYTPVAFLAFFAAQDALLDNAALRRICLVLTAILCLIGLDGLAQATSGETLFAAKGMYLGRVAAGMPHPNDLALVVLLLPLVVALATIEHSALIRAFVALSLLVAIPTTIASQSRNAWVGIAMAIFVTLALARDRRPIFILAALVIVAATVATLFDASNFSGRLATLEHLSQDGRIGVWLAGWEMFKDAPVFGIGPHTFAEAYITYLERATLPAGYTPDFTYMPWAHNLYLEMLAERGVVGLVGFLAPVVGMALCLRNALRPGVGDAFRPYAVGLAASIAAFLAMGLFDLTFAKDWVQLVFWLIIGMSVRLATLVSAEEAARRRPVE